MTKPMATRLSHRAIQQRWRNLEKQRQRKQREEHKRCKKRKKLEKNSRDEGEKKVGVSTKTAKHVLPPVPERPEKKDRSASVNHASRFLIRDRLEKTVMLVILLMLLGLLVRLNQSFAGSLGVEGAIYPIAEPDLLQGITETLEGKLARDEFAALQREWVLRTQAKSERPDPVSGVSDLPAGTVPLSRVFDPAVVVNHTVRVRRAGQWVVLAKQGQRLNPLSEWPFNETLVFINGDNPAQRVWLRQALAQAKPRDPVKVILVRGNVKTAAVALQHRVYFDQFGALCQRFGITHTPTRIFQVVSNGQRLPQLRIEEVAIDPKT